MIMPTALPPVENEVTILARVLGNGRDRLSRQWARQLLALGFSERDEARINELAERNRQGKASHAEQEELQGYAKAGCLLGILQSKARRALKTRPTRKRTTR
jgi:hypothetical protein